MASGKLTAVTVRALACPEGKKFARFSDSGGLYLEVMANGSKFWRGKYRVSGAERRASLGAYPLISLQMARTRWQAFKLELTTVEDPAQQAKIELEKRKTFQEVAQELIANRGEHWSDTHRVRTLHILGTTFYPKLAKRPICEITRRELIATLQPLEDTGKLATLVKGNGIASLIWTYAENKGYSDKNIAVRLGTAFKAQTVKHFAACTDPLELGNILRRIKAHRASESVLAALKLMPMLALRPQELFALEWVEVDLEGSCLNIAAARMKGDYKSKKKGAAHYVPLSTQALDILRAHQRVTGHLEHVFATERQPTQPLSENALREALIASGTPSQTQTGHGFRATFRSMASERLGINTDVLERQLAHSIDRKLKGAYSREQHFEARTIAMQRWADYLENLERGGSVIPLHKIKTA